MFFDAEWEPAQKGCFETLQDLTQFYNDILSYNNKDKLINSYF